MKKVNKLVTLDEAAGLIGNGETITIGGTLSQRIPAAFVRQLARRGVRGLELIKSSPGYDGDVLAAAGCVARIRCGLTTLEQPFGMAPSFRRAVQNGQLQVIEMGCPGVMASLQAAAFGLPFQAVAGFDGSDVPGLANFGKVKDPFTHKDVYVLPAIQPEWAILHVHEADVRGNARIYGTPVWDRLMSRAAKRCIIVAEKILPTEHFIAQPEMTVIPEIFVEAVVHAPAGAWPTSVFPYYGLDESAMRNYLSLSKTAEGFTRYLAETLEHDCAEATI
ncbi:MAG: CoA-transferase [Burkholderiaceae bacterium]